MEKTLERRLELLERSSRRWRWAACSSFAVVAAIAIAAAAPERAAIPDVTTVHKIKIVDEEGKAAGEIYGSLGSGHIFLNDFNGNKYLTIDSTPSGSTMWLQHGEEQGDSRIGMSVNKISSGYIEVRGRSLKGSARMHVGEDGTGEFGTTDARGSAVWSSADRK